jgi:tetratricopeptide (TPR) repeat protein
MSKPLPREGEQLGAREGVERPATTDSTTLEPSVTSSPPARGSMFTDPLVRRMGWAGAFMLVAFLATIVGALFFGILDPPAPRTAVERDLSIAQAKIESNEASATPEDWYNYATGLIATEQYSKAQRILDTARANEIEDPTKQYLGLAQVRLDLARKEYERAIEHADEAMRALETQYAIEKERFEATQQGSAMLAEGLAGNYDRLRLSKAEALEELGRFDEAIVDLNGYLENNERAADILVWRGDLKARTGDTSGAIADYEAASTFMPGDEALVAKLEKLGASND